jgi:riboflavin kinase/FMN adenylyltransferase
MKLITALDDITDQYQGGAISIGNFDGVHLGHAQIVKQLQTHALAVQGPSIVFTFDPHPVRLLRPLEAPPPLTWTRRKAELLGELGIDALIAYPTDQALLSLSADDFFRQIIVETLQAKAIVEGPNFYFGKGRQGNTDRLKKLCQQTHIECTIVEPTATGEQLVSSSRIRDQLRAGQVDEAVRILGRPYRLRGMITHGARRGSTLGFPTANLEAIDTLIPGHGVYAGRAFSRNSCYLAAINVGPNPTFDEHTHKVEIHLLDFDESIYGEPLEVDFVARLRNIQPFPDKEALIKQLAADVAKTRQLLS